MILAMPRVLRNLPLFRLTILVEGTVEPCRSRAYSSETMSIEFPDRGLARGRGSNRGELCLYVARTQAGFRCFWLACRLHSRACQAAARSSHLQGRGCRYQRTQEPAARGVTMGSRKLCSRRSTTRSDQELCACSLRQIRSAHNSARTHLPDPSRPYKTAAPGC